MELGNIELLLMDGETPSSQVNQNFAKSECSICLLELGDVNKVGVGDIVLIDHNKTPINFVSFGLVVSELIVVNTHEI